MAPKTSPGMTRSQIFTFVERRLLAGAPPTIREVQEAFGFRSPQTAREHLEMLVAEGRLVKKRGIARGYRLPSQSLPAVHPVPLLGRVQAGLPTVAREDIEDYLPVEERLGEDLFALRVQGESMQGAGILDGDLVIVRRQADADDGDIVVALIDDEATVKRLSRQNGEVVLRPENPRFKPIVSEGLTLLGKVVEVRRYLGGHRLQSKGR
jgi:repressor LexA